MLQAGRTKNAGGYRFGYQGQEADNKIGGLGQHTTAQFWEYDTWAVKRWNTDPVFVPSLSPYSSFSNSPISVGDPNGADSIFYNKKGGEVARVPMKGHHTYFLQHEDGNKCLRGGSYFQGYSYYSFFGDYLVNLKLLKINGPVLFTNVDYTSLPTASKENIIAIIMPQYNKVKGNWITFWAHSGDPWNTKDKKMFGIIPTGSEFDYKNLRRYVGDKATKEAEAANIRTAYMVDGMLMNRNEYGMVYWGATSTLYSTPLIEDTNQAIHFIWEKSGDELNEMNAWRLGRSIMLNIPDHKNILYNTVTIPAAGSGGWSRITEQTQGVDPTNPNGLSYDNWNIKK